METMNETLVNQLNNLVEINNDRIQGYERAMAETEEANLKNLFRNMASHSQSFKTELAAEVSRMGGTPAEGTKTSGKIYRAWMDLKASMTGKDKKAILNSCEFGEDAALETYDEVLGDTDANFTSAVREMIIKEREEIKKDHDLIKSLRDSAN